MPGRVSRCIPAGHRHSSARAAGRHRPESRPQEPAARRAVNSLMYSLYISELTVSEAREHLADAVERARSGEPVYVTRRGRRVVVIVDAEAYDSLVTSVEDAIDRAELRAARDDDDYVPWEDVKAISA